MKRQIKFCVILITAVVSFSGCSMNSDTDSFNIIDQSGTSSTVPQETVTTPVRPTGEYSNPVPEPVTLLTNPIDPVENSTLPRIDITFESDSYTLDKTNYTNATVAITNAGEDNLEETDAGIRIRGNSTAEAWKKPLKIKFDEKTSLFGRNAEKAGLYLQIFMIKP